MDLGRSGRTQVRVAMPLIEKTLHVAFVSKLALFHPAFDLDSDGLKQFVAIPPTHEYGPILVFEIEHLGQKWACFKFLVWEKAG